MTGKVELNDAGRFYLTVEGVSMEMHLVAEGLRKLAMIARLIATGSLVDKGFLFWDEPEANLNPRVVKLIAKTILHLCQSGIQVFLASHSLFLLASSKFSCRTPNSRTPRRASSVCVATATGFRFSRATVLTTSARSMRLQEELSQSDRYLESEAR